jgi:hypothetical protein
MDAPVIPSWAVVLQITGQDSMNWGFPIKKFVMIPQMMMKSSGWIFR